MAKVKQLLTNTNVEIVPKIPINGNVKQNTDGSLNVTLPSETPIATTALAGKVKPDGSTITVTQDGTISAINTSASDIATIKSDIGTIKTDITSIKGSVSTINTNIGTINTNINTIKSDISSMKTTLGNVSTVLANILGV